MAKPPRRLRAIRGLLTFMLITNWLGVVSAAFIRVTGGIVTDFGMQPEDVFGPAFPPVDRTLRPLSVEVFVVDPSVYQTVLGLLRHGLAFWLATIPMLMYARRLIDRAVATHPFTPEMARGLRRLGALVLVGGFLAEVVRGAATVLLYHSAVRGGAFRLIDLSFDFWWLLLGLTILAFAQVVEHGCALRAELDEVI